MNEKLGSIGVFDSGFGGLFVLRGLVAYLPDYSYMYLGDSARAPYGSRSPDEIYAFTKQGVEFLLNQGSSLVILACNTASSEALRKLQTDSKFKGKVLGVLIPFSEAAVARSSNNRIGVVATEGTVLSRAYEREILKLAPRAHVFQQAAPELVPLIESGEHESDKFLELLKLYILPLLSQKIDTLVLGCTHYGIIESKIRQITGPHIEIISDNTVVPESLAAYLKRHEEIDSRLIKNNNVQFFSTGYLSHFETLGSQFFGKPIQVSPARLA